MEEEKQRLKSDLEGKQDELDEHMNTDGELSFKLNQKEEIM